VNTLFTALRASIYAVGFIFFFGWLALALRGFDENLGVSMPAWAETAGTVLMMIGGSLVAMCIGVFVLRGRGTAAVFDPPREFVAVGPYKYVRNPMYIGGASSLLGFGLYHRSLSIVIFSLMVSLFLHLFVLLYEEPGLEKRFGQTYLEYKKSVQRWIPTWK
jgi:protein-S-isoprenylcysteine O-methyltransferase Ste14